MVVRKWGRVVMAAGVVGALSVTVGAAPGVATDDGYTFAVIGDIPYGDAQIANFPRVIAQINADPEVRWVDHLGDIKNGSSVCSDEYFQLIRTDFDQFVDPLVYTIGDNEWTDCHRVNNGAYNPLERLGKIRQVFFPRPGRTLGKHDARVLSQADQGIPENVRWERADVAFTAVHVVGSNDSLAPWTGNTAPTPEQTAEVLARTSAVIQEIHDTFADYFGFQPIVAAIARESANFRRPVYLFNGDSHVFNADNPLGAGSKWLSLYQIAQPVPNLTRITVDGSTGVNNYLRVTVHPHGQEVLTWTKVPFTP